MPADSLNSKKNKSYPDNFNRNKLIVGLAVMFLLGSMSLNADASNTLSDTISYIGDVIFQGDDVSNIDNLNATTGNFDNANVGGVAVMTQGVTWEDSQDANGKNLTNVSINRYMLNNDGLITYFAFEESSGSKIYDSSPNRSVIGALVNMNLDLDNCTGNCSGMTTKGMFGNGMNFDGVADKITTNSIIGLNNSLFSISFWAKYNSLSDGYQSIFNFGSQYNRGIVISHRLSSSYYLLYNGSANCGGSVGGDNTNSINNWKLYTITYDGRYMRNYMNNSLITTTDCGISFGYPKTTTLTSYIGAQGESSGKWFANATIDEFRIYNRAISIEEIQELYYSGFVHHNPSGNALLKTDNIVRPAGKTICQGTSISEDNSFLAKCDAVCLSTQSADCSSIIQDVFNNLPNRKFKYIINLVGDFNITSLDIPSYIEINGGRLTSQFISGTFIKNSKNITDVTITDTIIDLNNRTGYVDIGSGGGYASNYYLYNVQILNARGYNYIANNINNSNVGIYYSSFSKSMTPTGVDFIDIVGTNIDVIGNTIVNPSTVAAEGITSASANIMTIERNKCMFTEASSASCISLETYSTTSPILNFSGYIYHDIYVRQNTVINGSIAIYTGGTTSAGGFNTFVIDNIIEAGVTGSNGLSFNKNTTLGTIRGNKIHNGKLVIDSAQLNNIDIIENTVILDSDYHGAFNTMLDFKSSVNSSFINIRDNNFFTYNTSLTYLYYIDNTLVDNCIFENNQYYGDASSIHLVGTYTNSTFDGEEWNILLGCDSHTSENLRSITNNLYYCNSTNWIQLT